MKYRSSVNSISPELLPGISARVPPIYSTLLPIWPAKSGIVQKDRIRANESIRIDLAPNTRVVNWDLHLNQKFPESQFQIGISLDARISPTRQTAAADSR